MSQGRGDDPGEIRPRNIDVVTRDPNEIESEQDPYSPMMPQSVEQPPDQLRSVDKMANDNPAPTGMMAWAGFGCTCFALAALCVAFASPYWLQTYPNSFNHFKNIGLWRVCMDDYIHYKDESQAVYNECWWVFNRNEKYSKLREWLLPPWMITCQVLATSCLIIEISVLLLIMSVFLHFCPILNHEYYQTYGMFAASAMMFLSAMITFVAATMYGLMCQDWQWMPRPDMNFLSWGYGFFIINGIVAIASGICFFMSALKVYDELLRREEEYNEKFDLEMSGYMEGPPGSVGTASYPGSHFVQPSFEKQYSTQSGYSGQGYNGQGGYPSSAPYSEKSGGFAPPVEFGGQPGYRYNEPSA